MSLINDMLKDLDSGAAAESDNSLPTGLKSPRTKRTSGRGWILPVLAALAVIYALVVEFNMLGLMPKKSAPMEIPKPVALNSKWLEQAPTAATAEPVALEKVAPPPAVAAVDRVPEGSAAAASGTTEQEILATAAQSDEIQPVPQGATYAAIDKLLQAAATALQDQRLTTPAGDNAYQYFKSVLLLEPENPHAKAGIAQIQQIYLDWMDRALADNRLEAVRGYWHKARGVGVNDEILLAYQGRLESLPNSISGAVMSIPGAAQIPVIETPEVREAQDAPARYSISAASPQSADDAGSAARLVRDGLALGESRALRWLEQGSSVEQTAVILADFYAIRSDQAKLAQLLRLLNERGSAATIYVQALMAAGQQNFALAAEHLAGVEFSGPAEERRLRALAGFYQRLKDYSHALPLYSRLVNMPSGNVNDWLGLAISADAQQMTAVAQSAYQTLLGLTHPDPRVMGFARQRHQDLSFSSSR